ncbi:27979_t:CDS:2, partial [Dentiscutata erythropus]
QGFIVNLNGINYWIMGELGVFIGDLPQGNDIAGILRHNTYKGCRAYQEFQFINQQPSNNAKSQLHSQYGLRPLPRPLDPLLHDCYLHTPHDAYHTVAEKIARLLNCTCTILTLSGENDLINCWKSIEISIQWSHLPNPITHRYSFIMSDNLRILMIFPFILKRCLTVNSIKNDYLKSTYDRLHFSDYSEVRNYIIYTWALSAKVAKEVFSLTIQRSTGYFKLQAILNNELNALIK